MRRTNPAPAMANEPGKHLKLVFFMMATVLGVIAGLLLLFLLMRFLFGVLSYVPWLEYLYVVFLISFPAAVFVTAFSIFFKRSKNHPGKTVRIVSLTLISLFLLAWAVFFVWDIITFFRHQFTGISYFKSYNMLFLFSNVACIFFLGVAQALNMPKEKDWMQRRSEREELL